MNLNFDFDNILLKDKDIKLKVIYPSKIFRYSLSNRFDHNTIKYWLKNGFLRKEWIKTIINDGTYSLFLKLFNKGEDNNYHILSVIFEYLSEYFSCILFNQRNIPKFINKINAYCYYGNDEYNYFNPFIHIKFLNYGDVFHFIKKTIDRGEDGLYIYQLFLINFINSIREWLCFIDITDKYNRTLRIVDKRYLKWSTNSPDIFESITINSSLVLDELYYYDKTRGCKFYHVPIFDNSLSEYIMPYSFQHMKNSDVLKAKK